MFIVHCSLSMSACCACWNHSCFYDKESHNFLPRPPYSWIHRILKGYLFATLSIRALSGRVLSHLLKHFLIIDHFEEKEKNLKNEKTH